MKMYDVAREKLNAMVLPIEEKLDADVCWFCGPIDSGFSEGIVKAIEKLKSEQKHKALAMFLTTFGGSAEIAEYAVNIMRHHYNLVYFVIPDIAMSAGTILALSGDKIYMQYTSSLGPIDPQVAPKGNWVSALGYLDKVNELIERSKGDKLTAAELEMLLNVDMGFLSQCEQASQLAKTLVKDWLVKYKFKGWTKHGSTGKPVSKLDKTKRANAIVKLLGDNKHWHSHGRMISMNTLREKLRLQIDDFAEDNELRTAIMDYHNLLQDCRIRHNYQYFFHNRTFF